MYVEQYEEKVLQQPACNGVPKPRRKAAERQTKGSRKGDEDQVHTVLDVLLGGGLWRKEKEFWLGLGPFGPPTKRHCSAVES